MVSLFIQHLQIGCDTAIVFSWGYRGKDMQFAPDFAQEVEAVEIIEARRLGGVDVLASGVRMLILPLQRTPQEIVNTDRRSYTPRFGATLETPHAELKRNRQIRRADNSVYNIVETYSALGEMQIILEAEGTP